MKPANFPERKNARRKGAYARLPTSRQPTEENKNAQKDLEIERAALKQRIVPSAVHVMTKKRRAGVRHA